MIEDRDRDLGLILACESATEACFKLVAEKLLHKSRGGRMAGDARTGPVLPELDIVAEYLGEPGSEE